MYNLNDELGNVLTFKLTNGVELIATLLGLDEEGERATLGEPRLVIVNDSELALIPYIFTGESEEVVMHRSEIQTVVKTLQTSADDYEKILDPNQD
tara:strand:+ start:156 stop:443 length:288 start_codon:yes stop_codon:yes gene_type:complete